jgi:hypothetical protein
MKVRVELRRKEGRFIARYRPQTGFTGHLITARKTVQDREVMYLSVRVDFPPGETDLRPPGPELFEARITAVQDNEIRFMGWEVDDLSWHVQEWDCFVLR